MTQLFSLALIIITVLLMRGLKLFLLRPSWVFDKFVGKIILHVASFPLGLRGLPAGRQGLRGLL